MKKLSIFILLLSFLTLDSIAQTLQPYVFRNQSGSCIYEVCVTVTNRDPTPPECPLGSPNDPPTQTYCSVLEAGEYFTLPAIIDINCKDMEVKITNVQSDGNGGYIPNNSPLTTILGYLSPVFYPTPSYPSTYVPDGQTYSVVAAQSNNSSCGTNFWRLELKGAGGYNFDINTYIIP